MTMEDIFTYAIRRGFSFDQACEAYERYADDPERWNTRDNMRELYCDAAPMDYRRPNEPYIVRV